MGKLVGLLLSLAAVGATLYVLLTRPSAVPAALPPAANEAARAAGEVTREAVDTAASMPKQTLDRVREEARHIEGEAQKRVDEAVKGSAPAD